MSRLLVLALTGLLLLSGVRAHADSEPGCPDAQVFSGKLITDVCWDCLFPIRIAGIPLGGGSAPNGAAGGVFCSCKDALGVPKPGFSLGMWEPARIVELVHTPGCSPTLGASKLNIGSRRMLGHVGNAEDDASDHAMYHYHWYAFPLLILLDLFWDDRCNPDGYVDLDLLYLSELDPTWNNSELAFFGSPEVAFVANPIAQSACAIDAVSSTAGNPIDNLWWCAGSWGWMYPHTSAAPAQGRPEETSLWATRSLAALHRRGLARRTMGYDARCDAPIDLFLPKDMYKFAMFFPYPETKRGHRIGESDLRWGSWRNIPGVGEDHLYIIWRWNDCCATFF